MKTTTLGIALGLVSFVIIIIPAFASNDVRSEIYNLSQKEVTLSGYTFSGFYYGIDDNTSTEKLTLQFSNISADKASATLSDQEDSNGDRGIVYTVHAEPTGFDFASWGQYEKIKFFGENCLAAYDANMTWSMEQDHQSVPFLYDKSTNWNLMANDQISRILIDDSSERNINLSEPLHLEEGYQLAVKAADPNGKKVQVDLTKNGQFLDSKIVQPPTETSDIADETYYYKTDLGKTKGVVIIAVHFKNVFVGIGNKTEAEVDGVFQISDEPIAFLADQVNPISFIIKMDNKNNKISIRENKNIQLIKDIYIKTADQGIIDSLNPLRYYVYIAKPGYYMLHGSIANLSVKEFTWTSANFPGFYYDVDNNIGTERITFRLSDVNSDSATLSNDADVNGNTGIVYTTKAQIKNFKFKPWGQYKVVGFLGEGYFAAYMEQTPPMTQLTPIQAAYDDTVNQDMQSIDKRATYLYDKSTNRNLITNEQISKIVMDTDVEQTFTSNNSLKLGEDYELAIISIEGDKGYIELTKNGNVVDDKIIQFSASNINIGDQTYYYKADLGDTKEIVQIAVHLKNVFASNGINIVTADGIFQLSETPTSLKAGQHFDIMSISEVNPSTMTIKMDNKDNNISIRKNKNILLMGDISIIVADQDDISAINPLRYYIYKGVDVKEGALASKEQSIQTSEIKDLNENLTDRAKAANEREATNSAEANNNLNITAKIGEPNYYTTNTGAPNAESKKLPDFGSGKKLNETEATNSTGAKNSLNMIAKIGEPNNYTTNTGAHNVRSKKLPDFGSALAMISLLAVAYLAYARKQ